MFTSELSHGVSEAVPLDGGSDLLTAGGDVECSLRLETLGQSLLHQTGHPGHVLVAGVCAGTDQTVLDLERPSVVLNYNLLVRSVALKNYAFHFLALLEGHSFLKQQTLYVSC